jgi:serine/threonine-protein kinase
MIAERPENERVPRRNVGGNTLPSTIGRYKIRELLASGPIAELFKASTLELHGYEQVTVIKRLLPALVRDAVQVKRFVDAVEVLGQLAHPNIVEVVEARSDVDPPYVVMPYLDGMDVAELARVCAARGVRLPANLAALVVRDVLAGLEHAHAETILHRDVCPANVVVSWSGDVKLLDFGKVAATSGYGAPEQPGDARADVFAAGVVLAELVMAKRLFAAPTDGEVQRLVEECNLEVLEAHDLDFPIELLAMTLRALQPLPEDRWQSAGEFRAALDAWLQTTSTTQLDLAVFVCELSNDEPEVPPEDGVPSIQVDDDLTYRMPTSPVAEELAPPVEEQSNRFAFGTRAQPALVLPPARSVAPDRLDRLDRPDARDRRDALNWRWWHWAIGASVAAALGGVLAYLV